MALQAGPALQERTRERILDGALRAIALHGLSKLGMNDVSEHAGVSRGTVYRYFPSREALLADLADRESRRFEEVVRRALRDAPEGAERLRIVLEHAANYVRLHPALQRLLEAESAFVVSYLREKFSVIRGMLGRLLGPLLEATEVARSGVASPEQLLDWMTRVLVSMILFPDPDPEEMTRALTATYSLLTGPSRARRAPRHEVSTGRRRRNS
ncbi:MAG: putative HTH-type transcriptional regulator [Candidatus Binatia bacterium]|nr:MAG: putative HTH-type transcriptional regulator [Candidatus Binatia bacterium]